MAVATVASPSMAFYASVAVAVFVLAAASLPQSADAFECYVGDGSVMRRKMCPSFGTMGFSDVCFKRIGGHSKHERGEHERGGGELEQSREPMQNECGQHNTVETAEVGTG